MNPTQPDYSAIAEAAVKAIREDREIIETLSNALAVIRNAALNGASARSMQRTAEEALTKYRAYHDG